MVRLCAASLNYRDLTVARGRLPRAKAVDLVPLSDGAGDRVAGLFFQAWAGGALSERMAGSALGGRVDGVLTEYRLFDEDGLIGLPDHLTFQEAATLPCAALTAWHALFGGARTLLPGQRVLLLGTGGVSLFALQFALMAGAHVIATSSDDAKRILMREIGAQETLNYRDQPDWGRVIAEQGGADHVIEVGGAGTLPNSMEACRFGGAIHLIGVLTGGQIDPTNIMRRNLLLEGVNVGSRAMFEAMNDAITTHRLYPPIDRVFPFGEAREAYRHFAGARGIGKVVIDIS
nr:NAD(P)-dependent alcohol dehydrogenase [Gluconacetobacter sacchari]